jgi:hypothetical protein
MIAAQRFLVSGIKKDNFEDTHQAAMMVLDTSVAGKVQDRPVPPATEGSLR